ncbi:chondroitin sulfate proteoglycan 5 isoform X2 [Tiliqua scincoides]|uniref:chondroitin sulfate proteoglycan 5 isoform X2 n=1 Tax=Tiliqua scincoides TaxID=71010 RepID=UPI0034622440
MGRPVAAAACLLALAGLLAASDPQRSSPNATDLQRATPGRRAWQPQQAPLSRPAPPRSSAWPAADGSPAKAPQSRPPAALPASQGPPLRPFPGQAAQEERGQHGSARCPGCPGVPQASLLDEPRGEGGPLEALSGGTGVAWPVQRQKVPDRKEFLGSPPPAPESQEDAGSGDQPAQASPDQGTALPPTLELTQAGPGPGLSSDSAETDHLLGTFGAAALPSPTLSSPAQASEEAGRIPGQGSTLKEEPLELWVDSTSSLAAEGAPGHTDLTWLNTEAPRLALTPPVKAVQTPKPSLDPLASEIIDIDYYDLFDGESLGGASADSTKRKPSEDKGMSWSLHDLYDDFTPFDVSDFYPTTSFYTDGDEEDLEEPEEEEEEEEEDGGGGLVRDLEDENDYRFPTPATPQIQTIVQEAEPTSRHYLVPPLQTFVISGGHSAATPRLRPAEAGKDLSLSGGGENGTECRSGYVRHNNSCKSVCETFPSYCHNGGQCYLVENLGAFCRCNTQDYIWHKGIRCESIITDFQVMCVAVGSAALVVLLLFMMTVFFAKKLYLLKTENSKLRKTKYRTPSELHNDNFSLSTIAEGSHPNDDPSAPQKLQDPLKSCLKEEESFNIQNSMSPKLDNGKGDLDDSEVNCLQNNLT